MKKFVLAAAIALTAAVSMSAPSQAGRLVLKFGHHHGYHHHHHNWHPYVAYNCWVKKKAVVDAWGNVYVKKVKVCG